MGAFRTLAFRRLPAAVAEVLDQADDALFDKVQKTSNPDEQNSLFSAMRELRKNRPQIEQRFREHLTHAFDAFERGEPLIGTVAQQIELRRKGLSLVEADELEEQLAAEQIAAFVERKHTEALVQLNQRIAVLCGVESLESSANPVGPVHASLAFRHGLEGLALVLNTKLVLYKLFERELSNAVAALYTEVNLRLTQLGIELPQEAARPAHEPDPNITRQLVGDRQDQGSIYVPGAKRTAMRPSGVTQGGSQHPHESIDDIYASVRDLCHAVLAAQRSVGHRPSEERVVATPEVRSAMRVMQQEPSSALLRAADDPQASLSSLLRQEVLRQVTSITGVTGGELSEQDEHSVFLIGMLFDVLLSQRSYEQSVRRNFVRMSVPYARAAMLDQHLFDLKTHPARQLLNELAEACDGNKGDTPSERDLLSQVNQVVSRLNADFNEDLAIFTELEGEFKAYFEQYRKRVELAERRAAEAQRGKERLEEARIMASMELASLMGARELPPVYDVLLSRFWTHHLAVTFLREGPASQRYIEARRGGEALWWAFLDCENGAHPPADLADMLLPVLASSGVVGPGAEDVLAAARTVLDHIRLGQLQLAKEIALPVAMRSMTPEAPAPEAPAVAARPVQPSAVVVPMPIRGETAPTEAPEVEAEQPVAAAESAPAGDQPAADPEAQPALEVVGGTDTMEFDPADAERIRALTLGAWVEFVDESGESHPAKLSWISPISSRLLFVNRRGARQCAASVEELAVMMKQGKLTLRVADSAFERALTNVLGKLRDSLPDSQTG
ncbi:MAG: DUF1631 domain-containing protein [Xanthomonadales bacterium]|nr:DUF1631 domain-containing protein [Xanthomonadales bacterium]